MLLVVGAVVLALVLGAGATMLIVQPWSTSAAQAQDPIGPTVPQQSGSSPFLSPSSPSVAPSDPGTQLSEQARIDQSAIRSAVMEGQWVPQISSKSVGMRADGIVYDEADIWRNHQELRGRYGAVLLNSSSYRTFSGSGFWVTIVASQASSSPEAANAWCSAQSFPRTECYAKRIGQDTYDDTSRQR